MSELPTFAIRVDGTEGIGLGHVARMATLGLAAQRLGASPVFLVHARSSRAVEVLARRGLHFKLIRAQLGSVEDAAETASITTTSGAVMVDGYHFNDAYLSSLKASLRFVVYVDDTLRNPPACDGILNNNVGVRRECFEGTLPPLMLLGASFALVGETFVQARRAVRPAAHQVLVTFGGSDPSRATLLAVRALAIASVAAPNLEARVIVGGATPEAYADEVRTAFARDGIQGEVAHDVQDMADRMAAADIAISASGSTCLELCTVGVPALILSAAQNQVSVARTYGRLGAMLDLGPVSRASPGTVAASLLALASSPQRRAAMVAVQHSLVDGLGAERAAAAFLRSAGALAP